MIESPNLQLWAKDKISGATVLYSRFNHAVHSTEDAHLFYSTEQIKDTIKASFYLLITL